MIRLLSLILTSLSFSLLTAACDSTGQPRELPSPTFQANQLFPALKGSQTSPNTAADDFESRIEQLIAGDDPNTDTAPARATQFIPLGASLVAELPDDHDQWRWSVAGDTTLISFTPAGQNTPEVLLLARTFPFSAAQTPSFAFSQFVGDVDPSLSQPIDITRYIQKAASGNLPITSTLDTTAPIPVDDLLNELIGTSTLTGRRGLGYTSHPKSFSGWRYVGKNRSGTFLRFATSEGIWGPQPILPDGMNRQDLQTLLGAAAHSSGQDLRLALPDPPENRLPHRPARHFLGQAELSPTQGVYIAILCHADPHCSQATHIAHLLDRLQPSQIPPSARAMDHERHLSLLGLQLK